MSLRVSDVWGEDPTVLLRYAQLLTFAQGRNPDRINLHLKITRDNGILDMLRCRFVLVLQGDELTVFQRTNCLPRVLLIQRCRILETRSEVFAAVTRPEFKFHEEVVLERQPDPEPIPHENPGTAKLVASSTDSLTIEADTPSPALLLITDSYSEGWTARALAGSSQTKYAVMPANWCLRAVPLEAGHHHLRLEYISSGFHIGQYVSVASLAVFLVLGVILTSLCTTQQPYPAGRGRMSVLCNKNSCPYPSSVVICFREASLYRSGHQHRDARRDAGKARHHSYAGVR
jgi:hypothetical protein